MIVKRKNEYCLLTRDGSRTLGCHPTPALAVKQEAAIMTSKAAAAKGSEFFAGRPRHPIFHTSARIFAQARHPGGSSKGGQWASSKGFRSKIDVKAVDADTDAHYTSWSDSLSSGDKASIHSYTDEGYSELNHNLRSGKPMPSEGRKLSKILNDSPNPPLPDFVFRAASGRGVNDWADNLDPGNVVKMKGFQSATVDPNVIKQYSGSRGVVMRIKPKSGAYIKGVSEYPNEMEFLIGHGKKFKITDIGSSKGLTLVDMEEL